TLAPNPKPAPGALCVRGGTHVGVERSDALHMMIESLVALGDFREAARYAEQARELDLSVGTVYSGWGRGLLPAFLLGDWDGALRMANAVREAWAADDRPPIHALAAALACTGAILGYRGEEGASADWFRFVSPRRRTARRPGCACCGPTSTCTTAASPRWPPGSTSPREPTCGGRRPTRRRGPKRSCAPTIRARRTPWPRPRHRSATT